MMVMAIHVQHPRAHLTRDIEILEEGSLVTEASVGHQRTQDQDSGSHLEVLCMTLKSKMFLNTTPTFWGLLWGESKVLGQKWLRVYQAILHWEETKAQKNFPHDSYTGCLLLSIPKTQNVWSESLAYCFVLFSHSFMYQPCLANETEAPHRIDGRWVLCDCCIDVDKAPQVGCSGACFLRRLCVLKEHILPSWGTGAISLCLLRYQDMKDLSTWWTPWHCGKTLLMQT